MDLAEATVLTLRHLAVANWIRKESRIAAVLDLDKRPRVLVLDLEKIRVSARFG